MGRGGVERVESEQPRPVTVVPIIEPVMQAEAPEVDDVLPAIPVSDDADLDPVAGVEHSASPCVNDPSPR